MIFLFYFYRSDPNHQRLVVARLVQGVYSLAREREQRRNDQKHNAHATSQRCKRVDLELKEILIDDTDSSYFGAIYELKSPSHLAPRYVIASRGMIISHTIGYKDMKVNLKYLMADPEQDSRRKNVWLARHSLGASIALLVGRKMAMSHVHITTYLFNPPFISVRIERMMKNEKLNNGVHVISSFLKAGIATALKKIRHEGPKNLKKEDVFDVLSNWMPNIFVHPNDKICAKYIRYFQHREKMEGMGFRKIEEIVTKHSARSLTYDVFGKGFEPFHILPTANLTINSVQSNHFRQAHGIHQWWQQHTLLKSKIYEYKS
ncbi:GDSL esterase/lipase At4g10955-like [Bidens hawaiensis]|uniref:GDSL esterase/lipase At4g10955-like n=1 Tax=Bidens hawaiensis TaxID=980011 RepID=UPI004049216B